MLFISKNKEGVPAWKLVLERKKTVTRRLKPVKVGAVRGVQAKFYGKSLCKIKVISCISHKEWIKSVNGLEAYDREAKLEGFDEWWSIYPRKVAKVGAVKAYRKALLETTPGRLLDGARTMAKDVAEGRQERQWVPYPASWLNGGRWDDEPTIQLATVTAGPQKETHFTLLCRKCGWTSPPGVLDLNVDWCGVCPVPEDGRRNVDRVPVEV